MSMLFALVLFGCADDGTQCERLAAQPTQYASKASCQAGQEGALQSDVALKSDYPTVVSRCLRTNVAATSGRAKAKLAWSAD